MSMLDTVVGRVEDALKLAGLWENTLFVWQSGMSPEARAERGQLHHTPSSRALRVVMSSGGFFRKRRVPQRSAGSIFPAGPGEPSLVEVRLACLLVFDQQAAICHTPHPADNGAAIELGTGAKSSYPLRGGYYSNWQGGVLAAGLASGGLIPNAARGTRRDGERGMIHIADWFATFCNLAGADPTDHPAAAAGWVPLPAAARAARWRWVLSR